MSTPDDGVTTDSTLRVDSTAIHGLTGFQRDLLYVIAGLDQPSGQTIKEDLEARSDQEITHGRLYPNLDTVVDAGLVSKGTIDRRTNYYEISEGGLAALRDYHDWGSERLQ